MNNLVRPALVAIALVLAVLGFGGRLPHEWFGLTTADLVGWAIVLFLPTLFLVLLLVIMDRQRQLKQDMAWIAWRLGGKAPEGKVVQLRRGSGS